MTAIDHAPSAPHDQARLEAFVGQVLHDVAAAQAVAANHLGDRLGLYRHLATAGPATARELADATGTHERLVLEWLRGQAVAGYLEHEPTSDRYVLPSEHVAVLADDDAPVSMGGAFEVAASLWADLELVERAFRGDGGVDWDEHDPRLFSGIARVFGPIYAASLVHEWLPALDGVVERLEGGASVADVGCGVGVSSVLIARAFPASSVVGLDRHASSIAEARARAEAAGVGSSTSFEVADAASLPPATFDLVCLLDCLHDMGDPLGVAVAARRALVDGGTLMVVEPRATDGPADVGDPVARLFHAGSLFICTPCALAQGAQDAMGAQAGPAAMTDLLHEAGFGHVRVAVRTPFNTVIEARA